MNSIPQRLIKNISEPADYYVWNAVNPPANMYWYGVASPENGARLIGVLAHEQLENDAIHSNAFGLVCYEDSEWVDWYSEDGEDIHQWAERMGI